MNIFEEYYDSEVYSLETIRTAPLTVEELKNSGLTDDDVRKYFGFIKSIYLECLMFNSYPEICKVPDYYKNDIRHIKGDTFSCAFIIENLGQSIETAKFTCRDSLNDNSNVLFQKTLEDGISLVETDNEHDIKKYAVRVAPDDTKNLQSGTYYYDLEVGVNSDVFTLMKGIFILQQDSSR